MHLTNKETQYQKGVTLLAHLIHVHDKISVSCFLAHGVVVASSVIMQPNNRFVIVIDHILRFNSVFLTDYMTNFIVFCARGC